MVPRLLNTFARGLAGFALVSIGGCIISSPVDDGLGYAASGSRLSGQFAGVAANDSSGFGGGLSQLQSSQAAATSRFASSLRGVSDSVASALTIEPKTIPPANPLSLASSDPTAGPELHVSAARVYEARNNVGQALSHYESALLSAPNDSKVLTAIARLYDRNGDWVQAESYYLRASDADPQNAGIFNDLALCYARQGKVDEAVATIGFAVQQDPSSQRFRNNYAAILIEAGRFEEAYQQLASVHPEAVARYNAGYLMAKKGHVGPAVRQLQLAVQADPSMTIASKMLESLDQSGQTPAILTSGSRSADRPFMRRLPPT